MRENGFCGGIPVHKIEKLCVFCGSSSGAREEYALGAASLGKICASRNISLVYGAGNAGLMGILAASVLDSGGSVTGVIPEKIDAMVSHLNLTEKIVTKTMHERKEKMYSLADAFIALPGGIGTMEELFEVFTWRQLGYHTKPVGVLNICGFFDDVCRMLESMQREGFLKSSHANLLSVSENPDELIDMLAAQSGEYISKLSSQN